jgi:phosphoglycolate phosphatase
MILEGLNLDRHFASVYGGDSFPRKKPDPTGVYRLIEQAGAQPSETLFVGDSSVDLETARNAGVACCLVTYGIRPEHIAELEPDYRIHDLGELTAIVEANRKSSASGGSVV